MFIGITDLNANHSQNSANYAIKYHIWMPVFWRDMQPLSLWTKNYIQAMLKLRGCGCDWAKQAHYNKDGKSESQEGLQGMP
jgi:hypothetical protein